LSWRESAAAILAEMTNQGDEMPHILVVTDVKNETETTVVYRERIALTDLESDHFSGQLVERVGWAMLDTDALEHEDSISPPPHPIAA
jgi:hypothetical protein